MAAAEDFRRLALALPGAEERAHMGHPDFRVGGKIFAHARGAERRLSHGRAAARAAGLAIEAEPGAFKPAAGPGRAASTMVKLEGGPEEWLERTLQWACQESAGEMP